MAANFPSANLSITEDEPAQQKTYIEEKAIPATNGPLITPKASQKEKRFLSENSKLTFGQKINSKYIIFEIFSYSSGYRYKKTFSFISQISFQYKLFLSVNRELGQSMLTYQMKLVKASNVSQILNVQDKDKVSFIVDQVVSVKQLKQISLETDLIIKEFTIENSNPQQQLKELAQINNISLKKLALKDIFADGRLIEGLTIIQGGFPFLETLELQLYDRDMLQIKPDQLLNKFQIKKLILKPYKNSTKEIKDFLSCLEGLLTYINPISRLTLVSDRLNLTDQDLAQSTYKNLLLDKLLPLVEPQVVIILVPVPIVDQTLLVAVREVNSIVGKERFKIKGAYEYSKDMDSQVIADAHYGVYTEQMKIQMSIKEKLLQAQQHYRELKYSRTRPGTETFKEHFSCTFGDEMRQRSIIEGQQGTALDEFLAVAINLRSLKIFMNQGTLLPFQAKLSKDIPFYPKLTTLIFDNPCSWNTTLYIDIIKKSRGQIRKLVLIVIDPFLNTSLILEQVDPIPLRELSIVLSIHNDFINQQFYDNCKVLSKNLEVLEMNINYTMLHVSLFIENLDKLLPTLEHLHTFRFRPYLTLSSFQVQTNSHTSPCKIISAIPPCLLLGQPPHLTSLVLYPEMNFSQIRGLLDELSDGRKQQQGILKIKLNNRGEIKIQEFKELKKQYPMIELDINISE
ncbi:hypothetical protein FGO68_gene8526 [Halteria grandinella]|uniref:Uncharacterized protein n=1 Tax=Halteria grandinella TaxID=5974 RepID=A0A8J8T4B0_HALGN|nr:hypothetical protein FGO68_gene8526 [Halteria grandinella]